MVMSSPIGKVVKSYELEGLIGTGGFGAVYRARQAVVAREVAIKIIWPAFANHPNFIRRFEAEAQLVAGLEHPYIVPLYDYWRDPDGAYIVMRYLRGGALRDRMDGKLPLETISKILENIANALAMAHRYGVVHRDIKPENILLDENDNAYLADFGIAQILASRKEDDDMAGMGSPAYAAPEQLSGGITSPQTDIYSLGVVLFELLAGAHPFPDLGELSMTQMLKLRTTTPLPNILSYDATLPAAVNDVIQKATAFDPKVRYTDALSLAYAFEEAANVRTKLTRMTKVVKTGEHIPNPYKGLRAFQESDAALFFGREALIARLVNRLRDGEDYYRFLAIVGPSGSGKSSVARAGLLPTLRKGALENSQDWFYAEMIPSAHPFQELENVLLGLATDRHDALAERMKRDENALHEALVQLLPSDGELFLLIDQFEEVFTLVSDETLVSQFIQLLYVAVTHPESRLRLVVTIRADFYDRPLLQPRMSDLMRERTEVVVPLSTHELERVIVEPARAVGVSYEESLVVAIIAEVKEQPAALPLLQYALSELFEQREENFIPYRAYQKLGGVRGALAKRADELYQAFDPLHRDMMRQLFLRLITLGEGTEDTRRRALLAEVQDIKQGAAAEAMRYVIETLGKARLITFDRDPITRSPTVEVTHEAIIREWDKLRGWLDESRNDVRLQRALQNLSHEWYNADQDSSFLLSGIRLEQYEKWLEQTTVELTQQERVFLEASIAERRQREEAERARAERERQLEEQAVQRLRLLVVVLLVAMVGAFGLTGFALTERARAEQSAEEARASAAISRSSAFEAGARNAQADDNGDLAIVLALLANELPDAPIQSRSTLANVALARGTRLLIPAHDAAVSGTAVSPDGAHFATASLDATIKVWRMDNGELVCKLQGHGGDVESVRFSPDSAYIVSSSVDFTAMVWDVANCKQVSRLVGHSAPVRQAVFTPDGAQVITGSSDNTLKVWDWREARPLHTLEGHTAAVAALDISPDGRQLLSGARDGKLLLWDVATRTVLRTLEGHSTAITAIDISTDGKRAVSGSGDGTLLLWRLEDGTLLTRLINTTPDVRAAVFTPDDALVIGGGADGSVQLWSTTTGLEIDRLRGHRGGILSAALAPNGRMLVTGSVDNTARVWQVGNAGEIANEIVHDGRITELVVGASGTRYTAAVDGVLRVTAPDDTLRASYRYEQPILALAVRADEARALVGLRDGTLIEIALADGQVVRTLDKQSSSVLAAAYSPNGELAVSSSQNGEIVLWDLVTSAQRLRYDAPSGAAHSVTFTPDGKQLIASTGANTLLLWSLESPAPLRTFSGHTSTIFASTLSPDGALLASGGRDGVVILWNVATGQEQGRFVVGTDTTWSLAFDSSGRSLAVGTSSGMIHVVDIASLGVFQRFHATGNVFVVGFDTQQARLFSGQDNGALTTWQTFTPETLVTWARQNRYIRELDCFEREQYRLDKGNCS